jgi:hypothetical protein
MPRKAKKVAAAPAPVAENTTPKKRGRKPGSKNKTLKREAGEAGEAEMRSKENNESSR